MLQAALWGMVSNSGFACWRGAQGLDSGSADGAKRLWGTEAVLSTTDKMLFLRRVSLFSSMTLEQLRVLTSHLEDQHFLAGEVIFSERDFGQELYIVVLGTVRIVKDYQGRHEHTLNVLGTGDFFGDLAIFEDRPRSATAVAQVETELLALHAEKFKQTIYQKPDMAFEIFRELSARVRRREEDLF
jgi:CRP-like cAMP-binding protein